MRSGGTTVEGEEMNHKIKKTQKTKTSTRRVWILYKPVRNGVWIEGFYSSEKKAEKAWDKLKYPELFCVNYIIL